ncbi:metallophosphoesterase [Candidatus Dojkabacteria bacterium]|nr:metallophosphoesterase [Candidatus Dojkabacteria bacterium]
MDPRSSATTEQFTPWSFSIITDTHNTETQSYDTLFQQVAENDSKMLIHVGDITWAHKMGDVHVGDYRYQPTKGLLALQSKEYITQTDKDELMEIHVALGNHDVERVEGTEYPNKKYVMLDSYENGICNGTFNYWGSEAESPRDHYSANFETVELQTKTDFPAPFNPEIATNGFCTADSTDHTYSFVRGNINFIILGYNFFQNFPGNTEDMNWIRSEVCDSNKASASIMFIHHRETSSSDGTLFPKYIIDELGCDSNLKAVFMGHGHKGGDEVYNGVQLWSMYGVSTENVGAPGLYDEVIIATVSNDNIEFKRTLIDADNNFVENQQKIFEVQGNFEDYKYPLSDDDNEETKIDVSYELDPGSTFVSFPYDLDGRKAESIAEYITSSNGNFRSIATYDNGRWISYEKKSNGEFYGNNFDLESNTGYIVNSTGADISMSVNELEQSDAIHLNVGWNLISLGGSDSTSWDHSVFNDGIMAKELLDELNNNSIGAKSVMAYVDGRYKGLIYDNQTYYGNDFALDSKSSYFVLIRELDEPVDWRL